MKIAVRWRPRRDRSELIVNRRANRVCPDLDALLASPLHVEMVATFAKFCVMHAISMNGSFTGLAESCRL